MAMTTRGSVASFFLRLGRQVWVRAAIFTLIGVALALVARFVGPLLPFTLSINLGQNAVESILEIIATAMLTVSTFSVTAMVTAFSSATTTATPRSTQLLIADPTSQNAVSTFVGAFTYSIVGIVALSTGYFDEQGRTILFVGTLVIIVIVVVTLLQWISHLSTFGRMSDVIDRVESAAGQALEAHAGDRNLGGRAARPIPRHAVAVVADAVGYITHVDVGKLNRIADDNDLEIHVRATPGRITDARMPLASIVGRADEDVVADLRSAFRVENHRTYEQDPRFGVIALTEIGSRALSPSTNDPGTAIEVIAALQRVFARSLVAEEPGDIRYPHVYVPAPTMADLLADAFRPLARDGGSFIEVQIRLQKCLASLAATAPQHTDDLRDASRAALNRSLPALERPDAQLLKATTRGLWADISPR